MEMIVIYDNRGHIYYCAGGAVEEPVGLQFMKVTIPEGKILKSIDVSGEVHEPVFEDFPIPETEVLKTQVEELTTQLLDTQEALAVIYENMEV